MQFEFLTTDYQFSHGKQPKGEGSWAFKIQSAIGSEIPAGLSGVVWMPAYLTLTKAKNELKRMIRAEMPKASHVYINVLP